MKPPPLAIGAGAGLLLAALLAPATGTALGKLGAARAERAQLTAQLAGPQSAPAPLLVSGLSGDTTQLVATIRERARSGGVLVEEASDVSPPGRLVVLRLRLSGPEKAVVALADALERDTPLIRLRGWRLAGIDGGVRLTGEAVAVRP